MFHCCRNWAFWPDSDRLCLQLAMFRRSLLPAASRQPCKTLMASARSSLLPLVARGTTLLRSAAEGGKDDWLRRRRRSTPPLDILGDSWNITAAPAGFGSASQQVRLEATSTPSTKLGGPEC